MNSLRPKNLDEIKSCLEQMTPNSKFIGGGTDYIIRMRMTEEPDILCYLGYIEEYKKITETDDTITIGAYATMTEIENHPAVKKYLTALADAASDVGSLQIRNNGTIGGNLGNASPAGDLIPVLYLLDAVVSTISPSGEREIPVTEIIERPGKTTLDFNEAITYITFKKQNIASAFVKLGSRKRVTISRVGASVAVTMDKDKIVKAKVVIGAISLKPVELFEAEEFLIGKDLSNDVALDVAKILSDHIFANTPVEFDRDYKVFSSKGVMSDVFERLETRVG